MNGQDGEHLRLLSLFFYIYGGLTVLGGFLPLIWLGFITFILSTAPPPKGGGPGPEEIAPFFMCFGLAMSLIFWATAGCVLYVGHCLAERKYYLFCLIVAGLICLNMPLGTILGVFTIIVLMRPSVKLLFEQGRPGSDGPFRDENPYRMQ
jgi:hypothetical protein